MQQGSSRDQFVKFLARGAEDEGRIFAEFFDYVGDPRDVCLYHWTDFEIHQMHRVARRWPALGGIIEQVIEKCVDLKAVIQSAVYLAVPGFSIKCVAPALGFHWRQQDIGAYQSMVSYWDYLENTDLLPPTARSSTTRDDCMFMWHVDQELTCKLSAAR
jgi:predicted RecB family nuclease